MASFTISPAITGKRKENMFEHWQAKVSEYLIAAVGLDVDSWPDQDYYSAYSDGVPAKEMAYQAIANEYGDSVASDLIKL